MLLWIGSKKSFKFFKKICYNRQNAFPHAYVENALGDRLRVRWTGARFNFHPQFSVCFLFQATVCHCLITRVLRWIPLTAPVEFQLVQTWNRRTSTCWWILWLRLVEAIPLRKRVMFAYPHHWRWGYATVFTSIFSATQKLRIIQKQFHAIRYGSARTAETGRKTLVWSGMHNRTRRLATSARGKKIQWWNPIFKAELRGI